MPVDSLRGVARDVEVLRTLPLAEVLLYNFLEKQSGHENHKACMIQRNDLSDGQPNTQILGVVRHFLISQRLCARPISNSPPSDA